MTSKTKVLDFIYANHKRLEDNWQEKLERINIWDDVCHIYNKVKEDTREVVTDLEGNTILAFIVLAYDNRSEWLEPHKDRFDNKVKIMQKLAGPSFLVNTVYRDIVYSQDKLLNTVIEWYLDFQKDYRWTTIMTHKEYASQSRSLARTGANSSKDGLDMGKMLKEADEREREADQMLDTLRTEFLNLNTVMEKEKRKPITDISSTNFMSHEGFIKSLNKRLQQEAAEERNEKERQKEANKKSTETVAEETD